MNHHTPGITGLILAGGRGSRMGGIDKGLQNFHGLPLALQTLMRLQLQSQPLQEVLINANRNLSAYESLGVPVWPDSIDGFAGPLAGFLTGLERCETPLLLPVTLPCFRSTWLSASFKPWTHKTPTWPWPPLSRPMAPYARSLCFPCSKSSCSKAW
jgi:molybdopterin-guanine dinucleotide biosynthesis protein A